MAQEYGDPGEFPKVSGSIDKLFIELCRSLRGDCEDVEILPTVQKVHVLLFGSVVDYNTLEPVYNTLEPLEKSGLSPREKDIFRSSQRAVSLQCKWQGLQFIIRCEIHDEFVTFTRFAEFGKNVTSPPCSTNEDLNNNFTVAYKNLQATDKSKIGVGAIRDFLFHKFWTRFHFFVTSYRHVKAAMDGFSGSAVFADFRGLILNDSVIEFADYDSDRGYTAKDALLPILKIPKNYESYECPMKYLLDGRAFYLSALAPQLPEVNIEERIPLEYIVYAPHGVNEWQLGRVVNNLHVAGTSRLAALKIVQQLHEVSSRLAKMDETL